MYNQKGFTLLEIVLSIVIFSTGIVAAFSLALSDMNSTKENYAKVRAAHLAREGIELIRNVRDSNWLKYQANYDCDTGSGGIQYCAYDEGLEDNFFVMDYKDSVPRAICSGQTDFDDCMNDSKTVGSSDNVCINDQECDLYNIDNYYVHDNTTTTLSTDLYRVIKIRKICSDDITDEEYFVSGENICNGAPFPDQDTKIGIEVTSRVRWRSGNKVDYIDIVAYLYDWRY